DRSAEMLSWCHGRPGRASDPDFPAARENRSFFGSGRPHDRDGRGTVEVFSRSISDLRFEMSPSWHCLSEGDVRRKVVNPATTAVATPISTTPGEAPSASSRMALGTPAGQPPTRYMSVELPRFDRRTARLRTRLIGTYGLVT